MVDGKVTDKPVVSQPQKIQRCQENSGSSEEKQRRKNKGEKQRCQGENKGVSEIKGVKSGLSHV